MEFKRKEEYYRAQREIARQSREGLQLSDAETIANKIKKRDQGSQFVNLIVSAVLLAIVIFVIMLMASGGLP